MASVETELSHLLTTRMTTLVPPEDREDSEEPAHLIPECFGLEDFTSDETDEELLANRIRESVIHFEPRLENPMVEVTGTRNNIRKALVTISGDLVLGSKRVRVTFPLVKHMD